MSVETWIKEFYPVLAEDCTRKNALEHTIRKWRGALPHNLKRHRVIIRDQRIEDEDKEVKEGLEETIFWFDTETCALCWRYPCSECPLYRLRDASCVEDNERTRGPYLAFVDDMCGARPMLRLLYKARKIEVEKARKKHGW